MAGRSRIDDETVDGLAQITLGYRKVYRSVGAAALLSPVCGTLDLLIEIAPDAGIYRDRLVSLISEAGSVAAVVLMFDQGDFPTAGRYLAIAARAAQQCDDDELRAVALGCRAFHATYSGTPQVGLEYASEAVAAAAQGIHPLTSGWIAAVASEMHATLGPGEEAACMRLLEMAQQQLAEPLPSHPWKGIGAFDAGKLTAYRGGDLMRLGRYPQAQAELHAALAQLDPAFAKHRCPAHIDLATAYLQVDEGVEHAVNALDIIAVTRHADSLRRVENLYPMIRTSGIPAARDLRRKLMEIKVAS